MKITTKMMLGATPEVITMLDGKAKVGSKHQFICYPAIKFPGVPKPVILIEDGQDEARPAKNYAAAEKLAVKIVKDVVKRAKTMKA